MNLLSISNSHYAYTVGDKKFLSKIDALSYAQGDISRLRLYFLDDEWSNVDWTREPQLSFRELVDLRCRQLRETYDTVSLFLSGGFDSMTILNGFIRNGLHIDEIMVWQREWIPASADEAKYALGIAREYQNRVNHAVKISHNIRTIKDLAGFYQSQGTDWISHPGEALPMGRTIRNWEFESSSALLGKHEQSRRVIIEGRDKPRLDFVDGKWYAAMNDRLLWPCMGNNAEQFYFSPDFPELYVKQCYMMVDWMERRFNTMTHELVHKIQSITGTDSELYEEWNLALGRDAVTYLPARQGKGTKIIIDNGVESVDSKISSAHMANLYPQSFRVWRDGIATVKQTWQDAWDQNSQQLKTVISKQHYLRDYKPRDLQPGK